MSQTTRQPPATSSNNPESSHEPKGPVGRPRNDHGVPTETRKYPLWLEIRPTGFIITQLSNMGGREPYFKHFEKGNLPNDYQENIIKKENMYCSLGELDN